MTLSNVRNLALGALALVYTSLTFGVLVAPAPAGAQTGPFYVAELAAPAKETRAIVKGVVWHCEGSTCTAAKDNSRPEITCARFAREFGAVTSFTAKGEALAEDKLASCNGK